MGSNIKNIGGDQMKNILLVITLLATVGFGGNSVEAASVPDNWSKKLKCESGCPRFDILKAWDNAAVLDKETGLVWEQSPDDVNVYDWDDAQFHCNTLQVTSRMGWRLPTVQELGSLIDTSQANPALPNGHPFGNIGNVNYWSATTNGGTLNAWIVSLIGGNTFTAGQGGLARAWCVRGGSGVDNQ
jgi:hypothetical protein